MSSSCRISRIAGTTLGLMSRSDWLLAVRIIDNICDDPRADDIRKFVILRPPLVIRFCYDPPFKIFYRLSGQLDVEILTIRRADPVPPLSNWDEWLRH